MLRRLAGLLAMLPAGLLGQSTCPAVDFLAARTVNLKPSTTSHLDAVRQSDGSYTGFEVTDAAPYRIVQTTPHFERQFAACLPHTIPAAPSLVPPLANPIGAGSQVQAAAAVGANYFVAHISGDQLTIYFDVFDPGHNLLSETPFTSTVGDNFESLALADLNGDGKLDLIAVLNTPPAQGIAYGGVWTFLGKGDGTFQPGVRQVLTSRPQLMAAFSVAIGDLNGDGKPDLVIAAPGASLNIFMGNGDGTFNPSAMTLGALVEAQAQVSVALADLNGDGKLDLVIAPCVSAQGVYGVGIALGNGNGGFQTPVVYAAVLPGFYSGAGLIDMVATGDLNGDGIPDIVTSAGTILFGDGKGGVASRSDYASNGAGSVMLGDFDGDGKTDILFGNGNVAYLSGNAGDTSLTVMFGAGGGVFAGALVSGQPLPQSGFTYAGPLPPAFEALVSADFNGDGIPDLGFVNMIQTSDSGGNVQLTTLAGRGNGQFSPGSTQTFAVSQPFYVESAVTADFNHDGKPDIAVLLWVYPTGGVVQIFPGKGDGTFGAPSIMTSPGENVLSIASADVNGDGIPDLIVTSDEGEGAVQVFLGKGDGTFGPPVFSLGAIAPSIAFGDFNGDGRLDMAVASEGESSVGVLLGHGDGTFANAIVTALPGPAFGFANDMAVADFDGDGKLDLAVSLGVEGEASAVQEVVVLSGKGDGTFPVSHVSPGAIAGFVAADVNGDKIPDLIGVTNPNLELSFPGIAGTLSVRLGNGDGTFQPDDVILPGSAPSVLVVADLNRDGSPDIATLSGGTGVVALLNLSQAPPALTVVSAASLAAGPLAPNEIVSAFGEGILAAGQTASGSPAVPTTLAGVTVSVKDSAGVSQLAPLYFVSPSQVNFILPEEIAAGIATVTVSGGALVKPLAAQVQIAPVAPTLFSVGSGIAAGYGVRVASGVGQTSVPVFESQSGTIVAAPIDVALPGQVYLTLYGTGFEQAAAFPTVVSVQGVSVPVTYAGPQESAGLDQLNFILPASLAGTGVASVVVTVGGASSNVVYVMIQ